MESEIAVVTGGSQGLGCAVAGEIIARGGRVAALARRRAPLGAARERYGERFLPIVADIADPVSVAEAYRQIDETFGPASILVNAAALYRAFAIDEATDADFSDHLDTNLLGPLNMIREAVRRMRTLGRGDIVNVSSESVARPFPFLSLYGATKAGLETLTHGLVPELREYDIRVSVFRVGRMHSEGASATEQATIAMMQTNPDFVTRYGGIVQAGGYLHDVGPGMAVEVPAKALVDTLAIPRSASATMMTFQSR